MPFGRQLLYTQRKIFRYRASQICPMAEMAAILQNGRKLVLLCIQAIQIQSKQDLLLHQMCFNDIISVILFSFSEAQ